MTLALLLVLPTSDASITTGVTIPYYSMVPPAVSSSSPALVIIGGFIYFVETERVDLLCGICDIARERKTSVIQRTLDAFSPSECSVPETACKNEVLGCPL